MMTGCINRVHQASPEAIALCLPNWFKNSEQNKIEEEISGTHHVFVARLLLIAHLIVQKLVSEVTKGVLVLYCWWDTKPIRQIGRWTFEVCRRRNRLELTVVPFVRPNFLVPD